MAFDLRIRYDDGRVNVFPGTVFSDQFGGDSVEQASGRAGHRVRHLMAV